MKKILIITLIALLLALTMVLGIKGIKIGKFEILGINGIKQENKDLDSKIQQAAKLADKDFKQAISNVDINAKKLKEEKQNYEDMVALADGKTEIVTQIEKYEIETLWVRIGNHATSEGVVMQMDVTRGNTASQDAYNLRFTVTGSYISITDFISAIENDNKLGFKIEEFKMTPAASGSDLQATFVCKEILIKDVSTAANSSTGQNPNSSDPSKSTNQNPNSSDQSKSTNQSNSSNSANSKDSNSKTTNTKATQ